MRIDHTMQFAFEFKECVNKLLKHFFFFWAEPRTERRTKMKWHDVIEISTLR